LQALFYHYRVDHRAKFQYLEILYLEKEMGSVMDK